MVYKNEVNFNRNRDKRCKFDFRMKTIKQIDAFQPDQQLKQFFRQIHLGQILFTISVICSSFMKTIYSYVDPETVPIHQQVNPSQAYDIWSFLNILSASDFWLFLFTSLALLKREQQRKGSLGFLISIFLRSQIVTLMHYSLRTLWFESYPLWNEYLSPTSIPLQLLLMVSISQSISQPHSVSYFCIKPFQVRTLFKPIFYLLIIQVFSLRIDILVAALVQVLLSILKVGRLSYCLAQKIERKFPAITKLQKVKYLSSISLQSEINQLDILKTNNSIILQEK